MSPAITFLVQAIIIIGVPPMLWHYMPVKRMLPLAVIQIITGIALGPSFLGRVSPPLFDSLFPPATVTALSTIANLAVILFAFTIGTHLDLSALRGRGRSFLCISVGAVAVPTLLGAAAGWWISLAFPQTLGAQATRTDFSLAIGICVGVTALPVLGAILREMGLLGQHIGQLALRCAVVNDAALWILLALLLTYMTQHDRDSLAVWRLAFGGVSLYHSNDVCHAALIEPPGRARAVRRSPPGPAQRHGDRIGSRHGAAWFALCSGGLRRWRCCTRRLAKSDPGTARSCRHNCSAAVLLHHHGAQGADRSVRRRVQHHRGATMIAALVGKIAGTAIPAGLSGEKWGDAFALGALMQAKGLVVFVALTILLDSQVIDLTVFSALVVMAVINDMLCMPLVRLGLARAAATANRALPYQCRFPRCPVQIYP